MALNNNFYSEIFDKENYWTELIDKKLMNIYYLNKSDGPLTFYQNKKNQLKIEYDESRNEIIKNFLLSIDNIINKINTLTNDYRTGKQIDFNELKTMFIVNQMNNKSDDKNNDINLTRQKVLDSLNQSIKKESQENNPYMFDDFFDETRKKVA